MTSSRPRPLSVAAALLVATALSLAAAPPASRSAVPLDADAWEFLGTGHRFEFYNGREALFLPAGRAWVKGSDLQDGTIEFDISLPPGRGFSGVTFRGVDRLNSEHFYLRHHLSGQPDASQYTPIYNGVSGWQIYAGAGFTAPVDLIHERWMHVRVDVNGDRAAVYVDSTEPVLVIDDLQRDAAPGLVGINAGGSHYANFVITPGTPEIPPTPGPADPVEEDAQAPDPGLPITTWQVSNPFAEDLVADATEITASDLGITNWNALDVTHRGFANLARLASPRDHNTVVAAVTLRADAARVARMRFGFSDRVHVFLNGRLLYAGRDEYVSRDYRFLGTMGLFDEIALPLAPGDNEVWFAVSEDFGGWGIGAQLVPAAGVAVAQ